MKKLLAYILLALHLYSIGIFNVFAVAPESANLIFHYDAQDINADGDISSWEPTDGASISSWQDAANSFTGSQTITAGQPLYQLNSINWALPGIQFDGSSDILEIQDTTQINLDESFSTKSFGLVIETSADITSTQVIYEQWSHYKWYGFQISGWKLYGWVWNTLDWSGWDEYKIIDYGTITANTSYYITLVHDNTNVVGYLDGVLATTLSGGDVQSIHGICKFDTYFGCSLYDTGWTIGIGAIQNDTLNLATQSPLLNYQGNYFAWNIGELISWDIALNTTQVATLQSYFVNRWEPDSTAPVIASYSPNDNSLLPIWNFTAEFNYSDETGGSGINTASWSITLQKWDGISAYWADISGTYISSSNISSWTGSFDYSWVPYGKYRLNFEIADNAWNTSSQEIIFYIDEIEMIVSTGSLDLWTLGEVSNSFSDELTVTVHTVGAAHDILLKHNTDLTYLTETIDQFSTTGYGYDSGPSYSGNITDFWSSSIIWTQGASINTNGEKNTYTYRIRIWSIIPAQQAGWDYEWSIDIWIELNY